MDNNKRPEDMVRITTPALAEEFIKEQVEEIKKQVGEVNDSEELLGYVAQHEDCVTVGFNNKLDEKIKEEAFSTLLLEKMIYGRIRIHRMTHQLHDDLQNAIANLMRYYSERNWI